METGAHSGALLNISFGASSKGTLPPGPPHGVPSEKDAPFVAPFIHSLFKVPSMRAPPPPDSRFPSDERGPYGYRCPHSEPSLIYLPVSPVKELSLEVLHIEPLHREMSHSYSLLHASLKVTGRMPPSRFPSRAPMEIDACLQSLFYLSFKVPSKGALPPGSLHRAPTERHPTSRAPFSHLSKSQ